MTLEVPWDDGLPVEEQAKAYRAHLLAGVLHLIAQRRAKVARRALDEAVADLFVAHERAEHALASFNRALDDVENAQKFLARAMQRTKEVTA